MSESEVQVFVNQEARCFSNVENVTDLVAALGFPACSVLVEQNGLALHRGDWNLARVKTGDRFELLTVVAGG